MKGTKESEDVLQDTTPENIYDAKDETIRALKNEIKAQRTMEIFVINAIAACFIVLVCNYFYWAYR